jgi:hypothetical protein
MQKIIATKPLIPAVLQRFSGTFIFFGGRGLVEVTDFVPYFTIFPSDGKTDSGRTVDHSLG